MNEQWQIVNGVASLESKHGIILMDADDLPRIRGLNVRVLGAPGDKYAWLCKGKKNPFRMKLARFLIGAPMDKQVDHANRHKLDNRKSNLRLATHSQNEQNKDCAERRSAKSPYKGVHLNNKSKSRPWLAHIGCRDNYEYLGMYSTPEEAARAYDTAARIRYKEFACTNFPLSQKSSSATSAPSDKGHSQWPAKSLARWKKLSQKEKESRMTKRDGGVRQTKGGGR